MVVLSRTEFSQLVGWMLRAFDEVIAPRVEYGANASVIQYGRIRSVQELPFGWIEEQKPGHYRVVQDVESPGYFRHTVGPKSAKDFLFPSKHLLFWSERKKSGWTIGTAPAGVAEDEVGALTVQADSPLPRKALLGLRECELAAVAVQDRVFLGGTSIAPDYQKNRELFFTVAVQCTRVAETCFCSSFGNGPFIEKGFDWALTEVTEGPEPFFVLKTGSEIGQQALSEFEAATGQKLRKGEVSELDQANQQVQAAQNTIQRKIETTRLRDSLWNRPADPQWQEIEERCLSCGNCTQVCPTCFCSTVEETPSLDGQRTERHRIWDSCFNLEHSYLHGGSVRKSTLSRYRQWLTHKLVTWEDQFGSLGCTGCGRCIVWCPVGIDLVAEVNRFERTEHGA